MSRRVGRRVRQAAAGPVKRSFRIAGHPTSVSLEPAFWDALHEAAAARSETPTALVAAIDEARVGVNLSSAIRVWLLHWLRGQVRDDGGKPPPELPGTPRAE
jgi:predicted DNA-binding ribbon-helix-helix protein